VESLQLNSVRMKTVDMRICLSILLAELKESVMRVSILFFNRVRTDNVEVFLLGFIER